LLNFLVFLASSGKIKTFKKDFDVVITDTETQALLLENELIKQHKPRYNILLKDAKSYPYIYITNDKHPKVGSGKIKTFKKSIN
jgi:excinuclease ABC subunit C